MTEAFITRSIAYHESGHAIAALVLGKPLWRVTINPSERSGECLAVAPTLKLRSGFTDLDAFDAICRYWKKSHITPEARKFISDHAVELCAGLAAQRLVDTSATVDAWHDAHKIRGFASLFPGEHDFEERMRARAQALVLQHRGEVARVADALVERHQLSGDQVRSICSSVDMRYRVMQLRIA